MKSFKPLFFCSALSLSAISPLAFSEVIQFENLTPAGTATEPVNSVYEGDYKVTLGVGAYVSSTAPNAYRYGPAATSDFLAVCACFGGATVSRVDGQLFTLNSIDIGIGIGVFDGGLTLLGHKAGSTTVSFNLVMDNRGWHTFAFLNNADFSNLESFTITPPNPESFTPIAVDNINISQVPVPATAWFLGSGLLGLGVSARRKLNAV